MRWILLVAMLIGCGGSSGNRVGFEGMWAVQFDGIDGGVTLAASGTDGIVGSWDFGAAGKGDVAGAVLFDGQIDILFARSDKSVLADAVAHVADGSMGGEAHLPGLPAVPFSASR